MHSIILVIGDIKMMMTIEEQTDGTKQLMRFCSSSIATNDYRAFFRSLLPTHHSIIPLIYHIHMSACIHPHPSRKTQLCQIFTLSVSTSHNDAFFGSFHPCHYTMIARVRDVEGGLSIDEEMGGCHELIELVSFSMATSDEVAPLVTTLDISSHFMLLPITDVESILIFHGQPIAIDVVDENLTLTSKRRRVMRPTHHPSVLSIADEKSVSLSIYDHISWLS